jgi:uncharacterized damage-inducible protein DinB
MTKKSLQSVWDHFRQVHGVTVRAIERIPEDKLDARPISDMRSVKELVDHIYVYVRGVPPAILKGELLAEDCPTHVERLATTKDLVDYANESFRIADAAIAKLTDAHVAASIPTFFGKDFQGGALIRVVLDEHLHHRGQLYAFLRAIGVEPPFMWSFDENAPEYQPRAMST